MSEVEAKTTPVEAPTEVVQKAIDKEVSNAEKVLEDLPAPPEIQLLTDHAEDDAFEEATRTRNPFKSPFVCLAVARLVDQCKEACKRGKSDETNVEQGVEVTASNE